MTLIAVGVGRLHLESAHGLDPGVYQVRQKGTRTTVWICKHTRGPDRPQARGTIPRPLSGR